MVQVYTNPAIQFAISKILARRELGYETKTLESELSSARTTHDIYDILFNHVYKMTESFSERELREIEEGDRRTGANARRNRSGRRADAG